MYCSPSGSVISAAQLLITKGCRVMYCSPSGSVLIRDPLDPLSGSCSSLVEIKEADLGRERIPGCTWREGGRDFGARRKEGSIRTSLRLAHHGRGLQRGRKDDSRDVLGKLAARGGEGQPLRPLLLPVQQGTQPPDGAFADLALLGLARRQKQNLLLNVRRQVAQVHDLREPGLGNP